MERALLLGIAARHTATQYYSLASKRSASYLFNVHVYLTVTAPRTRRFRQYL